MGEGDHGKPEDTESLFPSSQSNSQQSRPPPVELNGYPTSPNAAYPRSNSRTDRDLSNLKLAQNQTELSRQISELSHQVEALREMLSEFTQRESDGSSMRRRERSDSGVVGGSGRPGHGTRVTGKGKERERERETDR